MDVSVDAAEFATMKFGVGQPVPRKEDPMLLRGEGRYTDDLNVAGQVYGVMVRSRVAHGRINGIDTGEAAAMPGVLGIYTGADLLAAGFGMMPKGLTAKNRDGSGMPKPEQPPLTIDKVRYVGDPVAIVVAETAIQAKDAAEAVFLGYRPAARRHRRGERRRARRAAAARRRPTTSSSTSTSAIATKVAAAFARAAHVTKLTTPQQPHRGLGRWSRARRSARLRCRRMAVHAARSAARACSACATRIRTVP